MKLPEGKYRFAQEYLHGDETLIVSGTVIILNARPSSRSHDREDGVKLELLIKDDSQTKVEVVKR